MMAEFEMRLSEQKLPIEQRREVQKKRVKRIQTYQREFSPSAARISLTIRHCFKANVLCVCWGIILDDQEIMEMNGRSVAA